jgi:hypothetical protein
MQVHSLLTAVVGAFHSASLCIESEAKVAVSCHSTVCFDLVSKQNRDIYVQSIVSLLSSKDYFRKFPTYGFGSPRLITIPTTTGQLLPSRLPYLHTHLLFSNTIYTTRTFLAHTTSIDSASMNSEHSTIMDSSIASAGYPQIPDNVPTDDVVAIVTVYHAEALHANRHSGHATTQVEAGQTQPEGVNIFLRRLGGLPYYTMGRYTKADADDKTAQPTRLDVYLPGKAIGIRQCLLEPDWERNYWRLKSISDYIAMVNGAPIQKYTKRTKQTKEPLPTAIFLKQSDMNTVTIDGLEIEIWLLKSVREVYEAEEYVPEPLQSELQDVTDRPEEWAREQYNISERVLGTGMTVRVVQRFTGEKATAKVFRTVDRPEQRRDEEFLLFSKQAVDASVVQYRQSTQIENIPSIITGTYDNFVPYSALRDTIHTYHPGVRFTIATKLLQRIFSALSWMHYNHIVHGQVSNDSVLLRLVDQKVEHALLVDYTGIGAYVPGEPLLMVPMLNDGLCLMKLIEDCSNLWMIRSGPSDEAMSEEVMEQRTLAAMNEYHRCDRVALDLFERQKVPKNSLRGKKLLRLLDDKLNDWSIAQHQQGKNLHARSITSLDEVRLTEMIQNWERAHPAQNSIYKQYMLLTLGHGYLDELANQLQVKSWDTMPQEVCAKIKELSGDLEEPWQTFEVRRSTPLEHTDTDYNAQHIMDWLATCCEVYPEWRRVLEAQCQNHLHQNAGVIVQRHLQDLYNVLNVCGPLPLSMASMLESLSTKTDLPQQVDEAYRVWYHIPSRLFNVTQLQRLATPDGLVEAVSSDLLRADNFVEVRGDPNVEGCYVPMSMLTTFVDQFGLQLPQTPGLTTTVPTFDPSDFSQVPQSRIVLARPGLLGFGTMLRTNDQANFLYSRTPASFLLPKTFILTYFGDMKVLPKLPVGVRSYARPEHWSKYQTSDEFEASNAGHLIAGESASANMEVDETILGQLLQVRERRRAEARPPPKHHTRDGSPESAPREPKRARRGSDAVLLPGNEQVQPLMTNSFMQQHSGLMTELPKNPLDFSQRTVPEDAEGLEEDWAIIQAMLDRMPDEEEETEGITGFIIHGRLVSDPLAGSTTEANTSVATPVHGPRAPPALHAPAPPISVRSGSTVPNTESPTPPVRPVPDIRVLPDPYAPVRRTQPRPALLSPHAGVYRPSPRRSKPSGSRRRHRLLASTSSTENRFGRIAPPPGRVDRPQAPPVADRIGVLTWLGGVFTPTPLDQALDGPPAPPVANRFGQVLFPPGQVDSTPTPLAATEGSPTESQDDSSSSSAPDSPQPVGWSPAESFARAHGRSLGGPAPNELINRLQDVRARRAMEQPVTERAIENFGRRMQGLPVIQEDVNPPTESPVPDAEPFPAGFAPPNALPAGIASGSTLPDTQPNGLELLGSPAPAAASGETLPDTQPNGLELLGSPAPAAPSSPTLPATDPHGQPGGATPGAPRPATQRHGRLAGPVVQVPSSPPMLPQHHDSPPVSPRRRAGPVPLTPVNTPVSPGPAFGLAPMVYLNPRTMRPVQRGRRNASASPESDDVVPETRQASPAPASPRFAAEGAVSEREEVDNQADIETEDEGVAEEEEHAKDQLVWGQPTDEDREEVESQAPIETD